MLTHVCILCSRRFHRHISAVLWRQTLPEGPYPGYFGAHSTTYMNDQPEYGIVHAQSHAGGIVVSCVMESRRSFIARLISWITGADSDLNSETKTVVMGLCAELTESLDLDSTHSLPWFSSWSFVVSRPSSELQVMIPRTGNSVGPSAIRVYRVKTAALGVQTLCPLFTVLGLMQ